MKKAKILSLVLLIALFTNSISISAEGEFLPEEYIQYTEEIGEMYGICPEFIQAVIETESGGDPRANNGICFGLMRIYPKYHGERMARLGVNNLYDPYSNILVGTDYLAELFEEYEDPYLVLMVYNMGDSKAISLFDKGTYSEYAVSICERSAELERLHSK